MGRHSTITKEEIMTRARELIDTEGVDNFSLRKLAEYCLVAPSTIYLYFKDKLDLILQMAAEFWNGCMQDLNIDASKDFFNELERVYLHILEYLKKFNTNWISIFSGFSAVEKNKGRRLMETYLSKIQELIRIGIVSNLKDMDTIFIDRCGMGYLCGFLSGNIISMLMRFSSDYKSFDTVIKRLLQKKE